jgi:hypothetical protein
MALGAAGGLAGTVVIQALMAVTRRLWPDAAAPIRQDPGAFMVEQAEEALPSRVEDRIPATVEKVAAKALGLGYGLTFGAAYAAVRPRGGNSFVDGLALGAAVWAAGYLGWLPATGLMRPVWEQSPEQVAAPVAEHLAYGMATVATYNALRSTY